MGFDSFGSWISAADDFRDVDGKLGAAGGELFLSSGFQGHRAEYSSP